MSLCHTSQFGGRVHGCYASTASVTYQTMENSEILESRHSLEANPYNRRIERMTAERGVRFLLTSQEVNGRVSLPFTLRTFIRNDSTAVSP
jgi:hypothetical protein